MFKPGTLEEERTADWELLEGFRAGLLDPSRDKLEELIITLRTVC
jgi:hypothetical protein